MQEYGVSYNINVNTGQAIESMQQFKAAVEQFGGVSSGLDLVSKSISKINTAFSSMGTASTKNIGRLAKSLTSLSAHIDKLS